ncbi:MAG: peptide/nickel transport system ATP-binding protein, partial [Actinomycetota bacterium]|nr:peptide/nickel transport system ATP-binding protein [Actinomycetota bacterium]
AGESGCGKSTIAGAILRLLPAKTKITGRIELDGNEILELTPGKLRAVRWTAGSIVFQGAMHAMNPVQRIGEQIMEPILVHGQSGEREARIRAGTLLEQVGLPTRRLDDYPHELSGGQKQRIMIAMALACSPSLIVADEPTTALDVMVQAQILELLTRLSEELGLALVLVTHDLPVVAQVCQRAAVMYAGRIAEAGPIDALFHEPRHPYTRLLFAATPDLFGDEHVVSIPGAPPRLDHEIVGCAFRDRCDVVMDICATVNPELVPVGDMHLAACHRNDEVSG